VNLQTFSDDYSFIGNFKLPNISFLFPITCLSLTGCGEEPTPKPVILVPASIVSPIAAPVVPPKSHTYTKIVSSDIPSKNISLFVEAVTISDINNDGYKDVVIASTGQAQIEWYHLNKNKISVTDNRTAMFLNNGSNQFSPIDTQHTNPTGWVNDWLVINQPNQKAPYIIGIDHGREFGEIENFDQWVSKLRVFQYENGILNELTDSITSNTLGYYHNASSYGDLNNDGYQDFVTAEMNKISVFYGHPKEVFNEVTDSIFAKEKDILQYGSKNYMGSIGATLVIDVGGDGQNDIVTLPYVVNSTTSDKIDYVNGDILKFFNGNYDQRYTFLAKTDIIPSNYGYAFAKVVDLNNDGLQDIVGLMEVNTGSPLKIISVMLQQPNNTFTVDYVEANNSIYIGPKQREYMLSPKFEIIDIDGDRNLDLFIPLFQGSDNHKSAGIFFGDGAGNFTQDSKKADTLLASVNWHGTARTIMSDFNNDGIGDLLVLQHGLSQGIEVITPTLYLSQMNFA
jgi:hypothetical protein